MTHSQESLTCGCCTCEGHPATANLHRLVESVLAISLHTPGIMLLHWWLSTPAASESHELCILQGSGRLQYFHKPQGLISNILSPCCDHRLWPL